MKIFYAKNSNGNYLSADGKTRYVKLYGKAAYAYLRSDEGKLKRFVKISDSDNSDDIYLEIDTGSIPSFRVDERREQYVRDIKRESGICVISIYACEGHGDDEDKRPMHSDSQRGRQELRVPCCKPSELAAGNSLPSFSPEPFSVRGNGQAPLQAKSASALRPVRNLGGNTRRSGLVP